MADTSEIERGGATRLVGAILAISAAVGASAAFAAGVPAAAFGSDFSTAACTQACTLGLAFSRQASRLPPPPFMQATTIGLPTLSRQPSIICLVSTAAAGVIAKPRNATAIIRRTSIKTPAIEK